MAEMLWWEKMSNAFLSPWHIGFDLIVLMSFMIYVQIAKSRK
ncbi:hypothetical protein [Prochlorococcus marinus]|nr:hypothetical protein [Prochlorococcus marinus]